MERPVHSPLGASSAERWMNCAGSTALIQSLKLPQTDEPEYRSLGTSAHLALNHCLAEGLDAWEIVGQKFGEHVADVEMADAIQVFIDDVTPDRVFIDANPDSPSKIYLEHRIDAPEFHPQFYGTLDYGFVMPSHMRIRDYKHGQGVVVEPDTPQIKYYAYGLLRKHPEVRSIDLGIIQPRAFHHDGPIRSITISAEELRDWAQHVLLPAMRRDDLDFIPGPWCRFCPAKLVCPVLTGMYGAAALADPAQVVSQSSAQLDRDFGKIEAVNAYIKALRSEVERRAMAGGTFSNAKLVNRKTDRIWKPEAAEVFKDKRCFETKMLSPAQMEKIAIPGIKDTVKEYAYQPDAGLTLAPISDRRAAMQAPPSTNERFAAALKRLDQEE